MWYGTWPCSQVHRFGTSLRSHHRCIDRSADFFDKHTDLFGRAAHSVGKLGLSEEYGAVTLVERFVFNTMTAREFALAFPYCLPEIGPRVVDRLLGPETMARFEWDHAGSFFETGRAHRMALVERNGKRLPEKDDQFTLAGSTSRASG